MDSFQQFFIAGAVVAILAVALWALKRTGWVHFKGIPGVRTGERKLRIIERVQLTPQHSLCLVRLEEITLLIGTSPGSCKVLHRGENN